MQYEVKGYYDGEYRGLADSESVSTLDEANDLIHEYLSEGYFVICDDTFDGERREFNPDEYFENFEGDAPIQANSLFDDSDNFFTRDDEIEYIEIPLEEKIREYFRIPSNEPINIRCYIDENNNLEADIELSDCMFNIELDKPIDMRKIRKPSDLQKYVTPIFEQFKVDYIDCMDLNNDIEGCDNISASSEPNPDDWEFNAVPLKSLKKGAWFTIKPIAYPDDKEVYIKDEYDRETKKFCCGRCDDISYSREFPGTKLVYIDFIY